MIRTTTPIGLEVLTLNRKPSEKKLREAYAHVMDHKCRYRIEWHSYGEHYQVEIAPSTRDINALIEYVKSMGKKK